MNAQNPYPPMNNNIAPMPTQYPWAWAPKCRAPLLHHRVKERGGPTTRAQMSNTHRARAGPRGDEEGQAAWRERGSHY